VYYKHQANNMDEHDLKNLKFLMETQSEFLIKCLNEMSEDDLEYAQELLDNFEFESSEYELPTFPLSNTLH